MQIFPWKEKAKRKEKKEKENKINSDFSFLLNKRGGKKQISMAGEGKDRCLTGKAQEDHIKLQKFCTKLQG